MRRKRIIGAIVVAVTAMTMLTAAGASAKKGPVSATFSTKGSHHYSVSVFGGSEGGVTVSASAKNGATSSYSVDGTASKSKLKATWKGFGKVKMSFHAKGKPDKQGPPKGCKGPDTIVQNGTWKGKFTFKGENGYTKVSTKKAKGSWSQPTSTKPYNCGGGGGGGHEKKCTTLSQFDKHGFFSATQIKGEKQPSFSISTSDKKGKVQINRYAFTNGGKFDADTKKQTATVSPTSPFSGTGKFKNGKLSGSLKAKLPGDTVSIKGTASLSDGTCFTG
jgi:hypothetical protein